MAYSTRTTKFHGFLRKAFGEKPFTTWTIIIVLAGLTTAGIIWPGFGLILLGVLAALVTVGLAMFVWAMIEEEWM